MLGIYWMVSYPLLAVRKPAPTVAGDYLAIPNDVLGVSGGNAPPPSFAIIIPGTCTFISTNAIFYKSHLAQLVSGRLGHVQLHVLPELAAVEAQLLVEQQFRTSGGLQWCVVQRVLAAHLRPSCKVLVVRFLGY